MSTMVPVVLGLLALIAARYAGSRAPTGRNARIHKRRYYLLAARRGCCTGATGLGLVTLTIVATLAASADPGARYQELVRAGTRMLQMVLPFATLVVLSLLAYWLLPIRESTLIILLGLGPFTLLRPAVVLAATAWSIIKSTDSLAWTVAITATVSLLAVEPIVHHHWYQTPT
jgi:hypothetical protein